MNKPKEIKDSIPKSQLTQIQMSGTQVYKMLKMHTHLIFQKAMGQSDNGEASGIY